MKRLIEAMVVAALFSATPAMAEDAMIVLESQWTYAERDTAPAVAVDAFAGSAPEMIVLESESTPAPGVAQVGGIDAFPGSAPEMIVLESESTHADRFAAERSNQARAATDPALSQ